MNVSFLSLSRYQGADATLLCLYCSTTPFLAQKKKRMRNAPASQNGVIFKAGVRSRDDARTYVLLKCVAIITEEFEDYC